MERVVRSYSPAVVAPTQCQMRLGVRPTSFQTSTNTKHSTNKSQNRLMSQVQTHSRSWLAFWLLSYLAPFVFLFVLIRVFEGRPVDGRIFLVLFLGPFACGLAGSVWAFKCARLPGPHFTLFLIGTIVEYGVGFAIFWVVCILLFGVIAT